MRWLPLDSIYQHLKEFFVQNDPLLSYLLKGDPLCYADQVNNLRNSARGPDLTFCERQIASKSKETEGNEGKKNRDEVAKGIVFDPDKHRKHRGMVYFTKNKSSNECLELIEVIIQSSREAFANSYYSTYVINSLTFSYFRIHLRSASNPMRHISIF